MRPDSAALIAGVNRLHAQASAAVGIVGAAVVDEQIRRALLTKMRSLNSEMKKRLFDDPNGSLSSFSAKIDMAYALQIISKAQYDDLTTVRKIRNEFAHSGAIMTFDSPEIREYFKRFTSFEASETDYPRYYVSKLKEIEDHLEQVISGGA